MDEHLAFQVHLAWRAMRKTMLEAANKGPRSVSRGSYSIPILIELNPGISPAELAAALHLDASKVAFFLREMVGEGLVERTKSKEDRRVVELRLSHKGREFVQEALLASHDLEAPFADALDEGEKATLVRLLMKLRENVS